MGEEEVGNKPNQPSAPELWPFPVAITGAVVAAAEEEGLLLETDALVAERGGAIAPARRAAAPVVLVP